MVTALMVLSVGGVGLDYSGAAIHMKLVVVLVVVVVGFVRGRTGIFQRGRQWDSVKNSDVEAEAEAGSGSAGSGYFLWKRKRKR